MPVVSRPLLGPLAHLPASSKRHARVVSTDNRGEHFQATSHCISTTRHVLTAPDNSPALALQAAHTLLPPLRAREQGTERVSRGGRRGDAKAVLWHAGQAAPWRAFSQKRGEGEGGRRVATCTPFFALEHDGRAARLCSTAAGVKLLHNMCLLYVSVSCVPCPQQSTAGCLDTRTSGQPCPPALCDCAFLLQYV